MSEEIYNIEVKDIKNNQIKLSEYKNKVLLIVNTASKCGFTPQYEGLQKIYDKYESKDFQVLAFPCNQFGAQEPGDNNEIESFCKLNYGVSFPVFDKIEVNGKNTHPLFEFLKNKLPGFLGTKDIKWNFTKFLISKSGEPVKRYGSNVKPEEIKIDIEKLL